MGRVLFFVALAAVAVWWLFGRKPRRPLDGQRTQSRGGGRAAVDDMVACAHCGVHLPRPDAMFDADGRVFCSDAHRLAGPR